MAKDFKNDHASHGDKANGGGGSGDHSGMSGDSRDQVDKGLAMAATDRVVMKHAIGGTTGPRAAMDAGPQGPREDSGTFSDGMEKSAMEQRDAESHDERSLLRCKYCNAKLGLHGHDACVMRRMWHAGA